MAPSPGTGRFLVLSDRLWIERLIKDFGLFGNEPEESMDVSLHHRCASAPLESFWFTLSAVCRFTHCGAPEPNGFPPHANIQEKLTFWETIKGKIPPVQRSICNVFKAFKRVAGWCWNLLYLISPLHLPISAFPNMPFEDPSRACLNALLSVQTARDGNSHTGKSSYPTQETSSCLFLRHVSLLPLSLISNNYWKSNWWPWKKRPSLGTMWTALVWHIHYCDSQ